MIDATARGARTKAQANRLSPAGPCKTIPNINNPPTKRPEPRTSQVTVRFMKDFRFFMTHLAAENQVQV